LLLGKNGDDTFTFHPPADYAFAKAEVRLLSGRYDPGVRIKSKPSAGDPRRNRKIKVHWWYDGGPQPYVKYRLTATCRKAVVPKAKRALLVVCELAYGGASNLRQLYTWIETAGMTTVRAILGDDYRSISELKGPQATRSRFVRKLKSLTADSRNKAVDVVLMLHGLRNRLYFRDGGVNTTDLKSEIANNGPLAKLRACFSTACYGASHASDLVDAGFRVACGARGVYANGAWGIPTALRNWADEETFSKAVSQANNPAMIAIADRAAELIGFNGVDSHWIVRGTRSTRITSKAD
jgi:hypothetical protein